MNFYLANGDQKIGPYSIEQIQVFLKQGLVTTTDQVWAEGWPSWIPIGNVPGLAPIQSPEQAATSIESKLSRVGPLEEPIPVQANEPVQATGSDVPSEPNPASPSVLPIPESFQGKPTPADDDNDADTQVPSTEPLESPTGLEPAEPASSPQTTSDVKSKRITYLGIGAAVVTGLLILGLAIGAGIGLMRPHSARASSGTQAVVSVATDNAEAAGYRAKATAGDVEAARKLGRLYYLGKGVPKDYAEALKWLRVAADQGDAYGQDKIGEMYRDGHVVTKDYTQAMNWFQKAADQGLADAQINIGDMYEKGDGVTKDEVQAQKWFKMSLPSIQKDADQGDVEAQDDLGEMYFGGEGVAQDYSQALKWFQKAAGQGDAEAQYAIGLMYGRGQGVTQDYSQALIWFHKAADQGLADAQRDIGSMYENGWGVTQDYSQALNWFQKAAGQGDAEAQYATGLIYGKGQGVTQDYSQALIWFHKAADQSLAEAQRDIGSMYENGWGITKDYGQALNWFQKAADQGDAEAQNAMGGMYGNGLGVAQDYSQALNWFQKAADQGDADAQNNIGNMYGKGLSVAQDYRQAFSWYQKAADQGNADAQSNIGWMYENGKGVAQDYNQALVWYQKAADQGNADAQGDIAELHRANIARKLQSIIIDKVNFENLDIAAAIQFLQQKSKELDPDHQGINFVLRLTSDTSIPTDARGASAPAAATPPAADPTSTDTSSIHREVSITLANVPLSEILGYVISQTNLQYTVEEYAVCLCPSAEKERIIAKSTIAGIEPKLNRILLSLDFNNATIEEATNFLSIESKRLDPDQKGVNFIIQPEASTTAKPVSITLNNVPLGEALRYVCELANVKCKAQDDVISIVPP